MTIKGTFIYQAPELSRGERYGFAADVFSFALTMYELCDRVSFWTSFMPSVRESSHTHALSTTFDPPPTTTTTTHTHYPHAGPALHQARTRHSNKARDGRCDGGTPTDHPRGVESRIVFPHHIVLGK